MYTTIHQLDVSLIDEDPNQPRTDFNQDSLEELAATIRSRGIKTPISVRPNPKNAERFLINHGARRFRASLLAKKLTIPACIDTDYTEEDQLIENLQRDNLTALEISVFLGKLLKKGQKRGEIANVVGKSPSWVTQHLTLLNLPPLVAQVFGNGRCNDVTVICELAKVEKHAPEQLGAWLEDEQQEINRGTVKLLQDFLTAKTAIGDSSAETSSAKGKQISVEKPIRIKHPVVHVEIDNSPAILLLDRLPSTEGFAWFCTADGEPFEAALEDARLKKIRGK